MNYELLGISQLIRYNPVINEKRNFKIAYINVLEYFVRKYSANDEIATETLNLYTKTLLAEESYVYNIENIKKTIKSVLGFKIKKFKLITYRYFLFYDCFFITAINDTELSQKILDELKLLCGWRYKKKIDELYACLYNNQENKKFKKIKLQLEYWQINRKHLSKPLRKILITANMSAGKSTLINALIGKKVNKTQNVACTAKIHYIFNKSIEDGYISKHDCTFNIDADNKTLMDDNLNNKSNEISVGSFFRAIVKPQERVCIIDTPGVNSSTDIQHKELTYQFIETGTYDTIVCVLNATNIGTDDDFKYLQYLSDIVKKKRIVFVVNQLDKFNPDEDSMEECLANVKNDIKSFGFENAIICPISAYAGILAKKAIYSEELTKIEKMELQAFSLKFQEEAKTIQQYFRYKTRSLPEVTKENETMKLCFKLLENSGFLNLEKVLFG